MRAPPNAESADVVARHSPLTILVTHGTHSLHGRALLLELRVELEDNVLTIGCSRQLGRGMRGMQRTRPNGAEWITRGGECTRPLVLRNRLPEQARCTRPRSCRVSSIGQREPLPR